MKVGSYCVVTLKARRPCGGELIAAGIGAALRREPL